MKILIFVYIPLIFCLYSTTASAQTREVDKLEAGGLYWTGFYLEWKITEKLQLDAEIENRRFFAVSRQYQTVVRTTLFYFIHENLNIGGGIGYSGLYSIYTPTIQPEIRPHQEINKTHGSGRWKFNHRLRIEERFRGDTVRTYLNQGEVHERNLNSYSFDLRTRYEFATDFALIDKDSEQGHWNIQIAPEIMVNDNFQDFLSTFRFYTGLQYFLSEKIRLELGYLKSVEKEHSFDVLYNYNILRFTFRQRL